MVFIYVIAEVKILLNFGFSDSCRSMNRSRIPKLKIFRIGPGTGFKILK